MKIGGYQCSACGQYVKPDIDGMVIHKCPNSNLIQPKGFFNKVKSIFD